MWLADYDFFVNPAGPSPGRSPALAQALAPSLTYEYAMPIGFLVLTGGGLALGLAADLARRRVRRIA